jgi:hypothetical protein
MPASHAGTWVDCAEATLAVAWRKRGGARRAVLELLDGEACALTALERAMSKLSEMVPLRVSEREIVLHGACRECGDG